jgi:hypothetical protein
MSQRKEAALADPHNLSADALVRKVLTDDHADLVREAVSFLCHQIMEAGDGVGSAGGAWWADESGQPGWAAWEPSPSDERSAVSGRGGQSVSVSRARVRVGDVFSVPLDDERVGLGQVVATYGKDGYFFALFEPASKAWRRSSVGLRSSAPEARLSMLTESPILLRSSSQEAPAPSETLPHRPAPH